MANPFIAYEQLEQPISETLFEAMCRAHDLTYMMSDDHRYYNRGLFTLNLIKKAANELGMDKAMPIWNKIVDEKLVAESQENFHWKQQT